MGGFAHSGNTMQAKKVLGEMGEPVAIGRFERFQADYCIERGIEENVKTQLNGRKVAVIERVAGLTAVADLDQTRARSNDF